MPKISLFEAKKKSTKRIAISKFALFQVKLSTNTERIFSKFTAKLILQVISKNHPMCTENVPKRPRRLLFEARKKSSKGIAISKFPFQVRWMVKREGNEETTRRSIWQLIQNNTLICAENVPKRPKLLLSEQMRPQNLLLSR